MGYRTPIKDLSGQEFGRLTVKITYRQWEKPNQRHHTYCRCVCACGSEFIARAKNIKSGDTRSCGCLRSEVNSHNARTRVSGKKKSTAHAA